MNEALLKPTEDRHVFVVRVWREESQANPGGQWRGSVEHVSTGQRIYFASLEALLEFIGRYWGTENVQTATSSEQ